MKRILWRKNLVGTLFILCLYFVYTLFLLCIYFLYTFVILSLYFLYTFFIVCLYFLYIFFILSLYSLYTLFEASSASSRTLTFQKKFFICFNDSLSKMIKNAFCFILKVIFVLKILKFLSSLFVHVEKTV